MKTTLIAANTYVWLGLFALGFANGALREVVIKRFVADPYAHHLSAGTGILLFSVYGVLIWKHTRIASMKQAQLIGLYWLVLTVLTETFVLNRWISGLSWEQILQTYNLARGELWLLVLIWVGLLPLLLCYFKGPVSHS